VFAAIIIQDQQAFYHLEGNLQRLKDTHEARNGGTAIELKGNKIGQTIDAAKVSLLDDLFSAVIQDTQFGTVGISFYIMHKDDLSYSTANIKRLVDGLLKNNTSVDPGKVQTYLYYQLSSFLVKRLHQLPLLGDYVHAVICDNVYNLVNTAKTVVWGRGNLGSVQKPISFLVPLVLQAIHNQLPLPKHQGFVSMDFYNSQTLVIIQLCDILANFLLNSIRYLFLSASTDPSASNYKAKYDYISKYIDLSGLQVSGFGLSKSPTDLTSTTSFKALMGKV
jgi:hypothetical protein